jgi:hypothetical protein
MDGSASLSSLVMQARFAGACVLLLLVAASGCRDEGAAAAPKEPTPAEEFGAVAEKLFNTRGGMFDRTASGVLKRSIEGGGKVDQQRAEMVEALLREGETDEAVAEVEKLFESLRASGGLNQAAPHVIRGLAYLRQAEVQNCIARHNEDCCVFPLKGGGIHADKKPADAAAASFGAVLAKQPDNLMIRWVFNIAHMARGTYPGGVPKELLIPTRVPNASADFPKFQDVATACGITQKNQAGGVIAEDLDGDGLVDLLLSNMNPEAPLSLLRSKGDGTFENVTARAGLEGQLGGLNLVSTDYDNDGDVDVLVLRGAWLKEEGRIRKSLLRNDGNGTFTDVTKAAGLAEPAYPSQAGVWLDHDNDGDLDLFVGNESRVEAPGADRSAQADYPSNLFRNDGDGRFTDVAKAAGVTNDRFCKGAAAGDYDDDGWVDLYVSNIGPNRLYRNDGKGAFEDVAPALGVIEPVGRSFATWFFDLDNDGDLDIWVGAYDAQIADLAAWYLGKPHRAHNPALYRNKGDGTFESVTSTYELARPLAPMGANFGDLDNDGWLDLYLTTGSPSYYDLMPDVMLRNVQGTHFVDVTEAGGFGNLQKGHGAAFVDLDHDGDQDIFHQVGGFYDGDTFFNSLFENPGMGNRFVTLKLEGRRSNRLAYGARIKVVVKTRSGERAIHRAVGSVSSFGGSPARQEIGLGDATSIESVEIWWPASGTRQVLKGLDLDAFYRVVEGEESAGKLDVKRIKLGAK